MQTVSRGCKSHAWRVQLLCQPLLEKVKSLCLSRGPCSSITLCSFLRLLALRSAVPALRAIQAGFGYPQQLESWQGNDPCQPVTWSGLRCSTDGSYSTVLGM